MICFDLTGSPQRQVGAFSGANDVTSNVTLPVIEVGASSSIDAGPYGRRT